MKKFVALLLAALMLVSVIHVASVPVYASDISQEEIDEAPVPEGWSLPGDGAVSSFIPFSYECQYCHETHEGVLGILFTMFHLILSAFDLGYKAVKN